MTLFQTPLARAAFAVSLAYELEAVAKKRSSEADIRYSTNVYDDDLEAERTKANALSDEATDLVMELEDIFIDRRDVACRQAAMRYFATGRI